ncbi:BgTH12-07845 [Blumeria graminis f. sp. triticale]|uniref:BgTH12-03341 n=1 Tax=Blumeria graminis f. sp. triticale TaxID=1689686 RepID=A0A9W4GIE3_BLUGR|nr:BgTH12-03341 [Blumeria graminis f. sp. triticale]CAD6506619.1 BgTH12-07845 [Blumeria graminis f. sp. triticale]
MRQAKLPEFVGLLQAEWVKPHITQKDTGGKENVCDKVTDLNITIVTWINNYHQSFINNMLLKIFREDFVKWDPNRFAMVYLL